MFFIIEELISWNMVSSLSIVIFPAVLVLVVTALPYRHKVEKGLDSHKEIKIHQSYNNKSPSYIELNTNTELSIIFDIKDDITYSTKEIIQVLWIRTSENDDSEENGKDHDGYEHGVKLGVNPSPGSDIKPGVNLNLGDNTRPVDHKPKDDRKEPDNDGQKLPGCEDLNRGDQVSEEGNSSPKSPSGDGKKPVDKQKPGEHKPNHSGNKNDDDKIAPVNEGLNRGDQDSHEINNVRKGPSGNEKKPDDNQKPGEFNVPDDVGQNVYGIKGLNEGDQDSHGGNKATHSTSEHGKKPGDHQKQPNNQKADDNKNPGEHKPKHGGNKSGNDDQKAPGYKGVNAGDQDSHGSNKPPRSPSGNKNKTDDNQKPSGHKPDGDQKLPSNKDSNEDEQGSHEDKGSSENGRNNDDTKISDGNTDPDKREPKHGGIKRDDDDQKPTGTKDLHGDNQDSYEGNIDPKGSNGNEKESGNTKKPGEHEPEHSGYKLDYNEKVPENKGLNGGDHGSNENNKGLHNPSDDGKKPSGSPSLFEHKPNDGNKRDEYEITSGNNGLVGSDQRSDNSQKHATSEENSKTNDVSYKETDGKNRESGESNSDTNHEIAKDGEGVKSEGEDSYRKSVSDQSKDFKKEVRNGGKTNDGYKDTTEKQSESGESNSDRNHEIAKDGKGVKKEDEESYGKSLSDDSNDFKKEVRNGGKTNDELDKDTTEKQSKSGESNSDTNHKIAKDGEGVKNEDEESYGKSLSDDSNDFKKEVVKNGVGIYEKEFELV